MITYCCVIFVGLVVFWCWLLRVKGLVHGRGFLVCDWLDFGVCGLLVGVIVMCFD